ncbi:unnamed protein product [Lactuca virosa]|uniref:Polysaccharide biosynthesis domain-containing protein n=1 Tax=Lactuca virosa TaxID=75947 RepID=A0AAU9MDG9_9ASTR|nr:unnamed protein product [Lactuca virosa]
MVLAKRKIILPLVFLLVIISILRLLKLTITSSSFSSPTLFINKSSTSIFSPTTIISKLKQTHKPPLTQKEIQFLMDIIIQKSPCNLLVFGLQDQYLKLHAINGGGTTVFIDDNPENLKKLKGSSKSNSNGTLQVYKVEYNTYAKDAYKLLKHARSNSSCDLRSGITSLMKECKLGLTVTGMPMEVVKMKWDVIVVDGPDGDGPESPGRMGSIFMAGVLANGTNVVVHDVDRMIEKWFSWEFLCHENLVSSKGRFWNFRIPHQIIRNNSSKFCEA